MDPCGKGRMFDILSVATVCGFTEFQLREVGSRDARVYHVRVCNEAFRRTHVYGTHFQGKGCKCHIEYAENPMRPVTDEMLSNQGYCRDKLNFTPVLLEKGVYSCTTEEWHENVNGL